MIDQLSSLFSSQCSCRLVSRICRVSCSSHSSTIMRIRIQLRGCRLKQPRLYFSSHWLSIHDAFQKRWFTLNHLYIIPLLSSSSTIITFTAQHVFPLSFSCILVKKQSIVPMNYVLLVLLRLMHVYVYGYGRMRRWYAYSIRKGYKQGQQGWQLKKQPP